MITQIDLQPSVLFKPIEVKHKHILIFSIFLLILIYLEIESLVDILLALYDYLILAKFKI